MNKLCPGDIYMLRDDESILEFNHVNGFIESEIEPCSLSQEVIKLNHNMTFSAEMTSYCPPIKLATDNLWNPIDIEYRIPIMVQARWHKKPRINKKWLKRCGMKKDSILVKAKVDSVIFDTEHENPYEIRYTMTIDDMGKMRYEYRPDQLRKNLKMEMCYE